ncbi:MAG: SRPBCC family protein [Saprospiraceae bacterium]|uniref:SRPBCC family protein n=1 Tax=Candidatus Opimibacter skivensis TaxID=2982028 RepID=A0A9D7SWB3_9BACT|nr:SRPBCC family protein [Candidatus Opimibacter skivensis]
MKTINFEQFIPISLDKAWEFFASPSNLNLITPEKLHFTTLSEVPKQMYQGLIIKYRIRPMMNIPMIWVTEITSIKDKEYFVDEQTKGPYKLWRHEHRFRAVDNGVMMTDILTYDIGLSLLGRLAGILWVDQQVEEIFTYRSKKLEVLFGHKSD